MLKFTSDRVDDFLDEAGRFGLFVGELSAEAWSFARDWRKGLKLDTFLMNYVGRQGPLQ